MRLPRITTEDVHELWEAIYTLQERLVALDRDAPHTCPAFGCCGCGAAMYDVNTPPSPGYLHGEGYCWRCVRRMGIAEYTALPGRERVA